MKVGISLKINVSEIDKQRLFAGKKGHYLDATTFIDLDQLDQYGNSGMITQDVSKEERDQGVKGPILGNSKVFWKGENNQPQPAPHPNNTGGIPVSDKPAPADCGFDDLPF